MSTFNVYVIHSTKPLAELKNILTECGGYSYAGIIYKSVASKEGPRSGARGTRKEETKKTIVFCPEETVTLLKKTYPEYENYVANYNWESFPLPNLELGESWDLHISGVPNDYTVKDAEDFVKTSLSCILSCEGNYTVSFTPRLRETGEINGYGHITFQSHVENKLVRLCKLVLHNTPIGFKKNSSEKRMVTCVWHRHVEAGEKKKIPRVMKGGFENIQRQRPAVQGELVMMTKSGPADSWSGVVKGESQVSSPV